MAAGLSATATGAAAAPVPAVGVHDAATTSWQPFPAIYRDQYWAEYQMKVDYSTLLTMSQTRMLRDSGVLPMIDEADFDPWDDFAESLVEEGKLDVVVANGGCLLLGYNNVPRYSPTAKKELRFVWLGLYGERLKATYCYP